MCFARVFAPFLFSSFGRDFRWQEEACLVFIASLTINHVSTPLVPFRICDAHSSQASIVVVFNKHLAEIGLSLSALFQAIPSSLRNISFWSQMWLSWNFLAIQKSLWLVQMICLSSNWPRELIGVCVCMCARTPAHSTWTSQPPFTSATFISSDETLAAHMGGSFRETTFPQKIRKLFWRKWKEWSGYEPTHLLTQRFPMSYLDIGSAVSVGGWGLGHVRVPNSTTKIVALWASWGFWPPRGGGVNHLEVVPASGTIQETCSPFC